MRLLAMLVAVAVAAGCGARVTDAQRATALGASTPSAGQGAGEVRGTPDVDPSGGIAAAEPTTIEDADGVRVTGGAVQGPAPASAGRSSDPNPGAPRTASDVGVTPDTIRLGNVSTLSGPVPGLFKGAVIGTNAAIAHQNSLGGIHGRRLLLEVRDDQFDTGQNRAVTIDLLDDVFAFVGSFAVYDDAAAAEVDRSGIPDVIPALSGARRKVRNNFNVAPQEDGGTPLAPFTYYSRRFPDEIDAVGTLWGDVPISRAAQMANEAAGRSLGWNFVYSRGYAATETDFTADVIRMRQQGVELAFMAGSEPKTLARIAKAMRQQDFRVPIVTMNIGYEHQLVTLAGEALDGMYTTMGWSMFAGEDAATVPEVRLMNQWLRRVQPGYSPDLYSVLGWASARLLFRAMESVGPDLTRAAVNEAIRTGGSFDANGLLAPGDPGRKQPATCIVITQLRDGRFSRVDTPPTGFRCDLGGYFRSR